MPPRPSRPSSVKIKSKTRSKSQNRRAPSPPPNYIEVFARELRPHTSAVQGFAVSLNDMSERFKALEFSVDKRFDAVENKVDFSGKFIRSFI